MVIAFRFISNTDLIPIQRHYESVLDKFYKARPEAWLTPCEIFAPWYSRALATAALENRAADQPLCIIEIGGGNGTNALHILDYIKEIAPDVYSTMRYKLVDISAAMSERQKSVVGRHHINCEFINADFLDVEPGHKAAENGHCIIIALEVLDNLPHDKVAWGQTAPGDVCGWLECVVTEKVVSDDMTLPPESSVLKIQETYRPLQVFWM